MDRMKIIEAIVAEGLKRGVTDVMGMMKESLKRIGDMDLIVLAQEFGIDTDAILAPGLKEAQAVEAKLAAELKVVR